MRWTGRAMNRPEATMSQALGRRVGVVWLVGWALVVSATAADAQYFGRNKVQYEDFDFKILKTEHFDIYHYPQEAEAARMAARMAERWYARLSRVLDYQMGSRQPLILYASHPHFRQTNAVSGGIGEGTGGVTESFKRRIVLPVGASLEATNHVIGHELVHAFQFAMTGADVRQASLMGMPSALRLPLWFVEGMAEYLSLGPVDAHTAMWIREAASREKLPKVEELDDPDYFPYRYGHAFWAYVAGRWGDGIIRKVLLEASDPRAGPDAISKALGLDMETLSADWHRAILQEYKPVLAATTPMQRLAKPLITSTRHGGELNLAPELSPDGTRLVFLSERDLFSIDVFLADARTGEVIRKVVSTAADPHFDSLQFIASAGAWHPDGRQFAFAAVQAGQPSLTIVDATSGDRVREIRLPELGEIFNPTWSPDGRRVAFAALEGGFSDLFVYDLADSRLHRLTDDPYSDLDPAWSPDGQSIAFVTDRFTTDLDRLEIGSLRLALIDPGTGHTRQLPGFERAKHLSPQWSPDGQRLYFVSDPHGIANLHRMDVASGRLEPMTNLQTGISSITATSPAMSVASSTGRVAFTVYSDSEYWIYTAETPEAIAAGTARPATGLNAAVLPPARGSDSPVQSLLETATVGLPPAGVEFPVVEYDPSLSLDHLGQPSIGFGADSFGTYVGGGVAAFFSDMLGNHQLGAVAQASGSFKDLGGQVQYLNRSSRWVWGATAEYIPYRFGNYAQSLDTLDGRPVLVEETLVERQTSAGGAGLLAYPFSRSSRIEFTAGARHIGFSRELRTDVFSLITGDQVGGFTDDLPSADGLTLVDAGAALVYDTSVFGATSPILGRRYRLDFTQTAGSLSYSGVVADFRQYFMPVRPFTLAFRGLHLGRYGQDAEDVRLRASYLGHSQLVRGYDVGSFSANECRPGPAGECQAFDQLIGSRMLVAIAELRFPLWGALGGDDFYGPLPLELALFADGGVAWDSASSPAFADGEREFVRSVGAAARMNLFGYAVAEINYVRPLDRPGKGWMWQFALRPGF